MKTNEHVIQADLINLFRVTIDSITTKVLSISWKRHESTSSWEEDHICLSSWSAMGCFRSEIGCRRIWKKVCFRSLRCC